LQSSLAYSLTGFSGEVQFIFLFFYFFIFSNFATLNKITPNS
jgi:hypothetical protein